MRLSGVHPRRRLALRVVDEDTDPRPAEFDRLADALPEEERGQEERVGTTGGGAQQDERSSDRGEEAKDPQTWREMIPYGVSAIVAAWLYYVSNSFADSGMQGRIGPDAWPKIVLGLMFFVSCLGVVKVWLKTRGVLASAPVDKDALTLNPPQLYPRAVWVAVLATAVYVWAWQVLGYFLATVLYSLVLMWIGRQRHPFVLFFGSIGFSVFFLFLFMKVVYVALPLGEKPFSQVSLTLMSLLGIR